MHIQKSKKAKRKPPTEGCALGAAHREERARERAYEALQHLRVIVEGADLTPLYRKFFPEEFAREAPDYGSVNSLMLYYDRFSRLVGERLFPVAGFLEYDEAYDEPGYALSQMHVCMLRNWLFDNRVHFDGPESLHIVERLVILGAGVEKHFDSITQADPVFRDADFRKPAGHKFDSDLLRLACKEEKGMLGRLGLVADAILGGTGNVWLDLSEEEYAMSELPTWTEAEIKFLTRQFAEYKRMSKEIREFFHWCDSANKVERVKRLLRGCWVREDEERVRVRATPAPGRPLVETLGGLI
jgi:hypothetical protein